MKARTMSLLAGVGATLIYGETASAGFTGIKVVGKPNPYGLLVCNVFATFDRPGQDLFFSVFGAPISPMNIQVFGGTFYQHPFGGDKAPSAALVQPFPSLAFDTFVTIGVKKLGQPGGQPNDALQMVPGWPGFGSNSLAGSSLGWAVLPFDPQADPFNPGYADGNGQVLIGQFSTANGTYIAGMFRIQVRSNNVLTQLNVSFLHVPGPGALALLGTASLAGARRRRRA